MIDELGPPDDYCDNPYYLSGPCASLYLKNRVEAWIEDNKERVGTARERRARRSAAAKEVQDRKRAERFRKAQEWAKGVDITVRTPLPSTALQDVSACHQRLTEKALHAYVRHRLTNYDTLRRRIRGQEFSDELYPVLRERVDGVVRSALVEWQSRAGEA